MTEDSLERAPLQVSARNGVDMRPMGRTLAIGASVLIVGALGMGTMTGCASSSSNNSDSSTVTDNPNANNQQDTVFANQVIVLNEQLITLTDILSAKTNDEAVAKQLDDLARTANERIVLANGWLVGWGRATSEAPDPPGTLTGRQITAITVANGAKLRQLVNDAVQEHLAGTIAIADAELADGVNPGARDFATTLKANAEAELAPLLSVTS